MTTHLIQSAASNVVTTVKTSVMTMNENICEKEAVLENVPTLAIPVATTVATLDLLNEIAMIHVAAVKVVAKRTYRNTVYAIQALTNKKGIKTAAEILPQLQQD
jgi:cytochrome b